MADLFEVNRSGFYRWENKPPTNREKENEKLKGKIMTIQESSRYSYGSPRMKKQLEKYGYIANHKRIARVMRENDLNFHRKKKYKITTDSSHDYKASENLLNRKFKVNQLNKVWVSDITYIWTCEGWFYLCVIIDLCSRMVVGWSISSKIDTELVLDAFGKAYSIRKPAPGLLFHTKTCRKTGRNISALFHLSLPL